MKMTRLVLAAAVAIAVLSCASRPAAAGEAPWCAVSPDGMGGVIEDCTYWSFEACVPFVIAGNRGFCNENPRYEGPMPKPRRVRRR
jgi:hypothetical protein